MILNREEYRRRVLGCWMGKNIGGTLGAPFEFWRQVNDVSFYTQDLGGEPLPNDDLDLQLLWLIAMEETGIDIDAATLADYWTLYITPHWSEYGTAKTNLKVGTPPPFSGIVGNEWRHSCGAFIRSEIWACIAPGMPDVAARYAMEDAIVDHGDGEGTWGEIFFAAAESAAFVCDDLHELIEIGLSYVPADCDCAKAIRCAVECHREGKTWLEGRDAILEGYRGQTLFGIPGRTSPDDHAKGFDTGRLGYDAPSNVGLAVLALLEGGEDFGRVVCTATNCGEDTDCTAATAGAMFGIMHGYDAIPEKWIEPIGSGIKTISLNLGELGEFGGQVPQTVENLSERTEKVADQVLARDRRGRMILSADEATDLSDVDVNALRADEKLCADLATRAGVARHKFKFFTIDVGFEDGPEIKTGQAKRVTLTVRNQYKVQARMSVRWHTPEGWTIDPAGVGNVLSLCPLLGGPVEMNFTVTAGQVASAVERCIVEFAVEGRSAVMAVPVVFVNGNLLS